MRPGNEAMTYDHEDAQLFFLLVTLVSQATSKEVIV